MIIVDLDLLLNITVQSHAAFYSVLIGENIVKLVRQTIKGVYDLIPFTILFEHNNFFTCSNE